MERSWLTQARLPFISRVTLLTAGLCTYLFSPDDVVWHFIQAAPHARLLEHVLFGLAAICLGLSLLLKLRVSSTASGHNPNDSYHLRSASVLQSIGLGALLPLPGFLLLVVGEFGLSLIFNKTTAVPENIYNPFKLHRSHKPLRALGWKRLVLADPGLCCAFLSMIVFRAVDWQV